MWLSTVKQLTRSLLLARGGLGLVLRLTIRAIQKHRLGAIRPYGMVCHCFLLGYIPILLGYSGHRVAAAAAALDGWMDGRMNE